MCITIIVAGTATAGGFTAFSLKKWKKGSISNKTKNLNEGADEKQYQEP